MYTNLLLITLLLGSCITNNNSKNPGGLSGVGRDTSTCKPLAPNKSHSIEKNENYEIQLCDYNGLCSRYNEKYMVETENSYLIHTDKWLFACAYKEN